MNQTAMKGIGMNNTNVAIVAKVLHEWGSAIRGDWGGIDGRTCRDELWHLEDCLAVEDDLELQAVRDNAGICIWGGGHWQEHCREETCEVSAS